MQRYRGRVRVKVFRVCRNGREKKPRFPSIPRAVVKKTGGGIDQRHKKLEDIEQIVKNRLDTGKRRGSSGKEKTAQMFIPMRGGTNSTKPGSDTPAKGINRE